MSGRNSRLVSRTLVGAGVVVGLALLWSWSRTRAAWGGANHDGRQSVEQSIPEDSAVPELYHLAGDEAVVYLRGYMDGRRDEAA